MGSTPTGASVFAGVLIAVAASMFLGTAAAHAQIGTLLEPAPVPGSVPPSNYVGPGNPYPPAPPVPTGPSGETVHRFSDEEMEEYFDGRVADATFESPECSWSDRVCYGYVSVDALYWDRIRTGAGNIAYNNATGGVIFNAKSFVWDDWEALPRLTAGFVMDNGYAFESSYFYKDDLDTSNVRTVPGNVNMVVFGTPSAGFAPNYFQADQVSASSSVAIQSGEFNMLETNGFINFLIGFRWIELQDRLRIHVQKGVTSSSADLTTYNTLLGGQVGVRMNQHVGIFGFEGTAKCGMFLNTGRSHVTINNAGAGLANQTRTARGNSEAFMAEGEIMATYNPYIWLQMRLGWQIFLVQQTALAIDQIRQDNTTGNFLIERSDLIYHGPYGGIEFRW